MFVPFSPFPFHPLINWFDTQDSMICWLLILFLVWQLFCLPLSFHLLPTFVWFLMFCKACVIIRCTVALYTFFYLGYNNYIIPWHNSPFWQLSTGFTSTSDHHATSHYDESPNFYSLSRPELSYQSKFVSMFGWHCSCTLVVAVLHPVERDQSITP